MHARSGRRVGGDELLNPHHDVLPVGVLLQVGQVQLHATQQLLALLLVAHLQQLLHHVVCELVLHHGLQGLVLVGEAQHLVDHDLALALPAVRQALLDHVGRELVLRQEHDLSCQRVQDPPPLVLPTVLQHVLHHIVAVLILGQSTRLAQDLVHDAGALLVVGAVLQHPLDDAAAVGVRGQGEHVAVEGGDDELDAGRGHTFDALLDHVVAVLILHAAQHVAV
mmetsp:Transcript_27113/g.66501  ORF Transcript_27113/g.66501 Transcript_27113/m.66501 type:complete len:223 (-) Transcript_27113:664-1332(-)